MTESQTTGRERSGAARAGIVDAAARLLRDEGVGALTTRGVAAAAGVQAPTIYRLFGDKDGLIDAVAEHVMATYVAAKVDRESRAERDGDPVDDLRAGWRSHLEFGLANPDLYGLLNAPGRRERSPATEAGTAVLRDRVRRLAAAGLLRVSERRAVSMIHAAGAGAVLALLQDPADERDLGLGDAMLDAVLQSILAEPGTVADTTVATVVATFHASLADVPALTDAERTLMAEWLTRSAASLEDAPRRSGGTQERPA